MSQLERLTIILSKQISINNSLFNGLQWESFFSTTLTYLKKFDFKFPINKQPEDDIVDCLNTFRSSWWLNEKEWYVEYVYQENAFITVPHFATKIFDSYNLHSFDMMDNPKVFYSNITEIKLNLIESHHLNEFLLSKDADQPRFCHVKRLSLDGNLTKNILNKIRNSVNLKRIEHFQILSTGDDLHAVAQFIIDMTSISSLHIQCRHILTLFRFISFPLFMIRHLVLFDNKLSTRKLLFSCLHNLFPHITHLRTNYHSQRILCYVLNHFIHLERIDFRLNNGDHVPNQSWIIQHSRLMIDSFESEIFDINFRERIFGIWINQDKNFNQSYTHQNPIQ